MPSRGIFRPLGALEGDQDAAPDPDGVLERLESRCMRLPVAVTKVGVARTGGHDQPVVDEHGSIGQFNRARGDVDALGLA